MSMQGSDLCHDGKSFTYQEWQEENGRREADKDKNGKQKKADIPKCEMACREDACECCNFFYDRYKNKKKASITIPYDPV